MGRSPCCDKTKVKKGPWSFEEDDLLTSFVTKFGNGGNWISLPKKAGLNRCGKSCRLRWLNYLRPNIKHGDFTEDEDLIIYMMYNTIGSRWSMIASKLAGRTDNDVKNYWNTKLRRKILEGKFQDICVNYGSQSYINTNHNEVIDERVADNYTQSTTTPKFSSQYSESSSSSNSMSSSLLVENTFWMDLFSESFDSVVIGSHLVDEKICEIASLL